MNNEVIRLDALITVRSDDTMRRVTAALSDDCDKDEVINKHTIGYFEENE